VANKVSFIFGLSGIGFVLGLIGFELGLFSPSVQLDLFSYAIVSNDLTFICNPPTADKIGFVLHNLLIISYVIFRRLYFVGRLRSSYRLR